MNRPYVAPSEVRPRTLSWADQPIVLLIFFSAIAGFLIGTLASGEDWSGDAALYIMDARNIVLGLPYGQTDYVPNPANPINPAAYPPGLPLLLAPIYWARGVDLLAMKMLCLACFLLFLPVFWRIARDYLPPVPALLATTALGLHPFVWYSARYIASEFPFILFCYAGLYAIGRLQRASGQPRLGTMALAAIAVAAACVTRPIGFAIFPAAILAAAPDRRRLAMTLALLAAAGVLVLGARLAFPGDLGTYIDYFQRFGLHSIVATVSHYLLVRGDLLGKGAASLPILGPALAVALVATCLVGFVACARRRMSVFEWFCLGYAGFLVIYPISEEPNRYSLPLWPLVFLYFAAGVGVLGAPLGRGARSFAAATVLCLIAALYVARYTALTFGPVPFSMDAPQSLALYAAIRREVPAGATVLTRKPTVIALYAQRRATVWAEPFTDRGLWRFIARQHIDFIVQDNHLPGGDPWPPDAFDGFIARNRQSLQLRFENAWFRLYRVRSPRCRDAASPCDARSPADRSAYGTDDLRA